MTSTRTKNSIFLVYTKNDRPAADLQKSKMGNPSDETRDETRIEIKELLLQFSGLLAPMKVVAF
eukprot:scaffold6073_cov175-Skeletonema_marinoi.AAC.1